MNVMTKQPGKYKSRARFHGIYTIPFNHMSRLVCFACVTRVQVTFIADLLRKNESANLSTDVLPFSEHSMYVKSAVAVTSTAALT
jgi:hypothetical protein